MVGADLANLVNEAALLAARRGHEKVARADFTDALEKIVLGAERKIVLNEEDRRRIAYHEGGHAIVGMLTPGADPVRKVSIIPRGQALGVTLSTPDDDRFNYSQEELRAKIRVSAGGRVAEEVVYGSITTGAESDIQQVTGIARGMVARWGMSEKVGFVTVAPQQGQSPLLPGADPVSEATQELVDAEVRRIVDEELDVTRELRRREPRAAGPARGGAARARDARRGRRLRGGRDRPHRGARARLSVTAASRSSGRAARDRRRRAGPPQSRPSRASRRPR